MPYLDHNATTRPDPLVVEAMDRMLGEFWHNPSSIHRAGQAARQRIELARKSVADLIGAKARNITFTSSGTESIDLAIRGTLQAVGARSGGPGPPVVVTSPVEHTAVRDLLESLQRTGQAEVRVVEIGDDGVVLPDSVRRCIDDRTALVTIQWANNETGALQPIGDIGRCCRALGAVFHCDGTQWVGKMPTNLEPAPMPGDVMRTGAASAGTDEQFVDLLTFSPHKFHGPKGVGVLYSRAGTRTATVIHGEQERGRRGGTENVAGIVGAGVAAELARRWLADPANILRGQELRDSLEARLLGICPAGHEHLRGRVNGPVDPRRRLWNTTNIGFPRLEAEALLLAMSEHGLYVSAGAACSSGSLEASPVIKAMRVPPEFAHGSLRFSIARDTAPEEVDEAVRIARDCIGRLRQSMAGLG